MNMKKNIRYIVVSLIAISMISTTSAQEESEYIERLSRIPAVIELPYNDVVKQQIERYVKDSVAVGGMIGKMNLYIETFEEALEAYGLPLELRYLPVVESALNTKAVSKAGTTGLWQIMITPAKAYGLTVNSLIDERCDPILSSKAAAHILSDQYKKFGDWTLALAAYNCGEENVRKAITRAKGATDYWEIYPYLPAETRGYVPAFIAANYIMTYYCLHGITPTNIQLPEKTDTVMVSRNIHLEQVAHYLEMTTDSLRAINPALRTDVIPGNTALTTLRLPADKVTTFIEREEEIAEYRKNELLTRRATTAVKVEEATTTTTAKKKGSTASSSAKYVTVKSGQTLGGIAKANGTTVKKIQSLNGLKGTIIRAGQKLRVR